MISTGTPQQRQCDRIPQRHHVIAIHMLRYNPSIGENAIAEACEIVENVISIHTVNRLTLTLSIVLPT